MKLKINGTIYQAKESTTSLIGEIQVLGNKKYNPKRRNCVRVDFDNENQFKSIDWQDFSEWSTIVESKYISYVHTKDTKINKNKDYYALNNGFYNIVDNPVVEDISSYYETEEEITVNEFNQSNYSILCKYETNLNDDTFSVWLGELTNEELYKDAFDDLLEG